MREGENCNYLPLVSGFRVYVGFLGMAFNLAQLQRYFTITFAQNHTKCVTLYTKTVDSRDH